MIDMNFDEMKFIGRRLIWINGYVFSKIDRVLCDVRRVIIYVYFYVDFRENYFLDYVLIYIEMC